MKWWRTVASCIRQWTSSHFVCNRHGILGPRVGEGVGGKQQYRNICTLIVHPATAHAPSDGDVTRESGSLRDDERRRRRRVKVNHKTRCNQVIYARFHVLPASQERETVGKKRKQQLQLQIMEWLKGKTDLPITCFSFLFHRLCEPDTYEAKRLYRVWEAKHLRPGCVK